MHSATMDIQKSDYSCNICNKKFSTKFNRRRHIGKVHNGSGLFECRVCQKAFDEVIELKNHLIVVHIREKSYPCPCCGELFQNNTHLDKHVSVRHNNSCLKCNKKFNSSDHLLRPQQVLHQDDPLYTCEVCQKAFGNKNSLKVLKSQFM